MDKGRNLTNRSICPPNISAKISVLTQVYYTVGLHGSGTHPKAMEIQPNIAESNSTPIWRKEQNNQDRISATLIKPVSL